VLLVGETITHLLIFYLRKDYLGKYEAPPDDSPASTVLCAYTGHEAPTSSKDMGNIVVHFLNMFNTESELYKLPLVPGDAIPFFEQIQPKITEEASLEDIISLLEDFGLGENTYTLRPQLPDDWKDSGGNVYAGASQQ